LFQKYTGDVSYVANTGKKQRESGGRELLRRKLSTMAERQTSKKRGKTRKGKSGKSETKLN